MDSLTGDNLREFLKKSIQSSFKSSRTDVETAVSALYHKLSLTPPAILWCDNSLQLTTFPLLLEVLSRLRIPDESSLTRCAQSAHKQCPPSLVSAFYKRWAAASPSQFRARKPGRTLTKNVQSLFADEVMEGLAGALRTALGPDYSEQMAEALGQSARRYEDALYLAHLGRSHDLELHQKLFLLIAAMKSSPDSGSLPRSAPSVTRYNFHKGFGPRNMRQVALHKFTDDNLSISCFTARQQEDIALWYTLYTGATMYLFFERCCFVLQNPAQAVIDNELRLHNRLAPALRFADGSELYFWRGTPVPEDLAVQADSIKPWMIDKQRNVEIRRIMMEMYGFEKYLLQSGARIIHEDRYGRLFRKDFPSGEPLVAVEVRNSTAEPDGTYRHYILRVPPHITRAKQAVAWTFGLKEKDYDPFMES